MIVASAQEMYDDLMLALGLRPPHFLALIVCNSPVERREHLAKIREGFEEARIGLYELAVDAEHTSLVQNLDVAQRTEEFAKLCEQDERVAFAVDWKEDAIPADDLGDPAHPPTALRQLNLFREYLLTLPHPVLLWVTDHVHTVITRCAPDFYRVRSHVFEISTRSWEDPLDIRRTLLDDHESFASSEEAQDRIDAYTEIIESADATDPAQAAAVTSFVMRRGMLRIALGDLAGARADFARAESALPRRPLGDLEKTESQT